MNYERLGETYVVRLPEGLCYYESRAAEFVEDLARLAEGLHRQTTVKTKGVLLLQVGPADDRTSAWRTELAERCLFGELAPRVDAWRWLLSLIRNAPVPWVYAAAADAQGSAWELALSCQRRYWYAARAKVGFPEIAGGAFPPGGVLESLSKRAGRTRERWQAKPVSSAGEALDDGLIHFCADAQEWEPEATAMFLETLRVSPKSGVREARKKRQRDDVEPVDAQSRRAAFDQLGNVWRHERMGSHKEPSAWDYCWQLVKERAKLKQPGDLGRLICLIASRHLLSPAYLGWVQTHLVAEGGAEPLTTREVCLPPLVLDLNYVAPPTDVLVRLLERSCRLVLVASEAKELAVALSLLFNRLERAVGAARAQTLWERGVTWYQGVCDESRSLVLRWAVDDRFVIGWQGVERQFLRLEGNGPGARPGIMEWPVDAALEVVGREDTVASEPRPATAAKSPRQTEAARSAATGHGGVAAPTPSLTSPLASPLASDAMTAVERAVIAIVATGLVASRLAGGSLPVAVHVRSLFLEEMLRVSAHADGDLGAVVEALKASGWRFAGDEDGWDRFLRTRHDAYPLEGETLRLGARPLESANWEVGSWKHARALARRVYAPKAAENADVSKWNDTSLSLHLGMFLGLIAEAVAKSGRVRSTAAADHVCGVALGLPSAYGTPLLFLSQRGRRRVEYYARAHWPLLQHSGGAHGASLASRV